MSTNNNAECFPITEHHDVSGCSYWVEQLYIPDRPYGLAAAAECSYVLSSVALNPHTEVVRSSFVRFMLVTRGSLVM